MKTVFVYEHCTALGLGRNPSDPAHSLYREGQAMRDAVIADFRRIEGVVPVTIDDDDPSMKAYTAHTTLKESAAVVLILPEIDKLLLNYSEEADEFTGCRLGCSLEAIRITSDKLVLAAHFEQHAVRTPPSSSYSVPESWRFPVIEKRRDGAGSTDMKIIPNLEAWWRAAEDSRFNAIINDPDTMLQPYIPGRPASVAFLVGTQQTIPLLPCWQHIADDGRFTYLGGEIIEEDALLMRAVKLAQRAIECVPGLLGYVGVDLILGEAADGSEDYALEINPRLTTSYVGLRAMTDDNLMEIMWALCRGESGFRMTWKADRVRFQADGTVERISRR